MMTRFVIAAFAVFALVPAAASAAAPVQGSLFGPVIAVKGTTFTITTSLSPSGKSAVSAGSAKVTEQKAAPQSSLKAGACVVASGTRNTKGVVAATRITISQPVKGSCTNGRAGAGANRPTPPAGGTPRTGGGFPGNGGFAVGSVTKVKGSTLTVKGSFGGASRTTTVTVSSKTSLLRTVTVKPSSIEVKMCAFIQGTSADKGKTVKATSVALSAETKGTCTNTFRRPGN
jgi:hypothetical protein